MLLNQAKGFGWTLLSLRPCISDRPKKRLWRTRIPRIRQFLPRIRAALLGAGDPLDAAYKEGLPLVVGTRTAESLQRFEARDDRCNAPCRLGPQPRNDLGGRRLRI